VPRNSEELTLDEGPGVSCSCAWASSGASAERTDRSATRSEAILDGGDALLVRVFHNSPSEFDGISYGDARQNDFSGGVILAFIIGALVLGAFAPSKTAGFAAPGLRRLIASMETERDWA
jgi:hypothetical protein